MQSEGFVEGFDGASTNNAERSHGQDDPVGTGPAGPKSVRLGRVKPCRSSVGKKKLTKAMGDSAPIAKLIEDHNARMRAALGR
jgi:hypothetical protein